jgi:hypothetical protein
MRIAITSAVLGALAGLLLPVVTMAAPAVAAPTRPCGSYTLTATHAASAESYDTNGDRLECRTASSPGAGRDNRRILAAGAVFDGYKLYAFSTRDDDGVRSVAPWRNRFGAWTYGQEDDPDWNGCRERCFHRLSYDANDYFYVDYGNGSRKVSLARFETLVPGSDVFSVIYELDAAGSSMFSLDLS